MIRSVRNLKHRTILTLIYGLGLRKGEVQKLLVSHVDLTRGVIHIAQAKGNKDRILSLQTTLAEQLGRYLDAYRPAHWLFEGQTGGAVLRDEHPGYLRPRQGGQSFAGAADGARG